MKKRYLYGDASLIEGLLSEWQLIEKVEGDFAAVYKEPSVKAFWLKYYATAATHGGGYLTLMRLPAPTTEELIDIALNSDYEDESVAAILRLLDEEAIEKKNFRHKLINRLEQSLHCREVQHKRLVRVINLSSLNDPMNRRDVLGKSSEQVQQDAEYFSAVAERAGILLEKLDR